MTTERVKGDVLLEIRGLRIEGESDEVWREIVKGVDLTLRRGEVLGLIGESGAGKSTIGLAALAYARPGCRISSIIFDGVHLEKASEEDRRKLRGTRIAYVAQSAAASFNPAHQLIDQTIETAVREGTKSRSEAIADAQKLFERLQLPDPGSIGFRYPHQVSGGQLQRAMTAMAMSCRPDLIIFDEPTTALDVTTQVEVIAAIRDIVEQFHTAAIYITHDLAVVAQMADHGFATASWWRRRRRVRCRPARARSTIVAVGGQETRPSGAWRWRFHLGSRSGDCRLRWRPQGSG
jgi:peptide/nickel transport system ATP-binding protein